MNYQTFKQAGYKHIRKDFYGHVLLNENTGEYERFVPTKGYSGWALIYKNTHLEFCCTLNNFKE